MQALPKDTSLFGRNNFENFFTVIYRALIGVPATALESVILNEEMAVKAAEVRAQTNLVTQSMS